MYLVNRLRSLSNGWQLVKIASLTCVFSLLSACVAPQDGEPNLKLTNSMDAPDTISEGANSSLLTYQDISLAGVTALDFHGPLQLHVRYSSVPYLRLSPTSEPAGSSDTQIQRLGERLSLQSSAKLKIEIGVNQLSSMQASFDPAIKSTIRILVKAQERIEIGHLVADEVRLEATGYGRFKVEHLKASQLQASLVDHSRLQVADLALDKLNVAVRSYSSVEVAGRTNSQQVELEDYGRYRAVQLESTQARVKMRGYAVGRLWVHDDVLADTSLNTSVKNRGEAALHQG